MALLIQWFSGVARCPSRTNLSHLVPGALLKENSSLMIYLNLKTGYRLSPLNAAHLSIVSLNRKKRLKAKFNGYAPALIANNRHHLTAMTTIKYQLC